ncbi:hypothetical protein ABT294_21965 [Nonomuraea sp. NPDC000554]|uniref:WXG100-like domain-containing protein n=1 Tax=Nonomuraea sp. NPDC000554 TaxID=3154259 RepID=UPI00331C20BC
MSYRPGRVAIYGAGVVGIAAFVYKMLAVEYPDGDPERARQARDVWNRLADRLEQSPNNTYPSAEAVWKKNGGEPVEAFKKAVTPGLYPLPPAVSFPGRLALACRRNARACDAYAELVEQAQHAYWTAAMANFASFIFITTFPWQHVVASKITEFLIRRAQAKLLAKLLEHNVAKIVLTMLSEAAIGSTFFAVGDVTAVAGVKKWRGEDPGSFGDNAKQALKEWTASMAFYGVSDAVAPALKNLHPELQNFLGRLAGGSIGYGPTYDALNGESGWDLVPTWKQTLGRVLLYFTMAHKPPG